MLTLQSAEVQRCSKSTEYCGWRSLSIGRQSQCVRFSDDDYATGIAHEGGWLFGNHKVVEPGRHAPGFLCPLLDQSVKGRMTLTFEQHPALFGKLMEANRTISCQLIFVRYNDKWGSPLFPDEQSCD